MIAAMLLGACTHLAPQPDKQDTKTVQEDLYQDALQAIAEGRRNDASRELQLQIEREPLHAGAWLELALTQCALGHSDEAERLFAVIETRFLRDKPNSELLRLIAEAREEGCTRWHPSSSFALTAGRGIDQNVNQGALSANYVTEGPTGPVSHELTSDFRPMHDQYSLVTGEYSRDISKNGSVGFAQLAVRHNDRLHQYDSTSAFAGVETPARLGHWNLRGSLTGGLVTLGGNLYQRQVQAQLRIEPPLPLPAGLHFNLVFGGTYNGFLTLTNFNSNVWESRGQLTWRRPKLYASLSGGRLRDRALATRPGSDRNGWFSNGLVRRQLGASLAGEVGFTHQTWDSSASYAPGLIDEVRAENTSVLRANLAWSLGKHQSIQLEGRLVRNRENISIFQYNDRQLQLSWQWQGF